ncbi:hypothetical protein HanIR_Chr01g0016411 [Helianthus annuus]|nr:hypothetical protein HanIR_Chr01g0016411 [Helianthus annuus]
MESNEKIISISDHWFEIALYISSVLNILSIDFFDFATSSGNSNNVMARSLQISEKHDSRIFSDDENT